MARDMHQTAKAATDFESVLFEDIPIVSLIIDRKMNVVAANRAAREASPGGGRIGAGIRMGDFFDCDNAARSRSGCTGRPECGRCILRREAHKVFRTGAKTRRIKVAYSLSGNPAKQLVTIHPVRMPDGMAYVQVLVEDITLEEEYKEKLEIEKMMFVKYISLANAIILKTDKYGKVLEVNDLAAKLTGVSKKNILGRNWISGFVAPEDRRDSRLRLKKLVDGRLKGPIEFENNVLNSNGGYRILHWRVAATTGKDGRFDGIMGYGTDITEKKQFEGKLIESEEMFRGVFNGSDDAIFLVDFSNDKMGYFLEVNASAQKRLGYTRAEFRKMTRNDIVPRDCKNVVRTINRALNLRGEILLESYHQSKSGKRIPVEIFSRVLNLSGKKVVLAIVADLTEKNRAENSLRESELRYKTVADFTFDWEYWVDNDGKFIYCSPSCERITGYTAVEFMQGKVEAKDIFKGPELVKWRRHHHKDEAKNENSEIELRLTRKDGAIVWIHHICRQVYDTEGRSLGRRASNRDITEKKIAKDSLLASESFFKALTQESGDMVLVLDKNGVITHTSNSVGRLGGYGQDTVLGRNIRSFLKPGQESKISMLMKSLLAAPGRAFMQEVELLASDGRTRYFEIVAKNMLEDEFVKGITVNARDISDRKTVEENLKSVIAQLERSNEELEQFAYAASHDLKEPLRTVSNYIGLIQMNYGDQLGPEGKEYLDYSSSDIAKMYKLIQGLLAYSRIGKKENEKTGIDLNELAGQIVLDARRLNPRADISLHRLPVITANQTEMVQLFQNLIGNAIKFSKKKKQQTIRISCRSSPREWIFTVYDNGIGIKKEYIPKVFGLFEKLNSDREYEGTGIGLTLCKKIIMNIGGRIWIESRVGQWTKVSFTVPRLVV